MLSSDHPRCRVCGLAQLEPPWGDDGRSPSFEYCDCCGAEFGYQDGNVTAARRHRAWWLERGAVWFTPSERPPRWDLEAQLAQIPPDFL